MKFLNCLHATVSAGTLEFRIVVALRLLILTIFSQGYAVIRDPTFINLNYFSLGLRLFDT